MGSKLSPAARRDLAAAAAAPHNGALYCGREGAGRGLRVRWNIALALEEAGLAVMTFADGATRLWQWELTERGHAAARQMAKGGEGHGQGTEEGGPQGRQGVLTGAA